MGSKSAPSAPDYTASAVAQGEASREVTRDQTYANRPTQNTPWGSIGWETNTQIDPATGEQVTGWTQNTTLDPQLQQGLQDQIDIQAGRSNAALGLINRASDEFQTPMDWNNLPEVAGAPQVPSFYGQNLAQMGSLPDPNATTPALPEGAQEYNELAQWGENDQTALGDEHMSLDYSGLNDLNAGGGYQDSFAQTQYDRNASLQDPLMDRQLSQLDTQLRNQGLSPGTPAYDDAVKDMRDQQGERRGRMSQDAVMAGANEQQRQFGRELQQRQQGQGEVNTQGNFYNQSQAQQFGQGQQNFTQQNSLRGQQLGEYNQLRDQQGGQADAQFQRQMQLSNYQDQQRAQQVGEQMQMGGQGFSQQMQSANFQNMLRQQGISEEQIRRGMSLNEMNALLSGQQVNMPQMPQFQGAGAADATNYLGASQLQGQFDNQRYATALGPVNAMIGAAGQAYGRPGGV